MQKPKGTYDLYGDEGRRVINLIELFKTVIEKYNYEYFRTPLFESSELFHRGVGDTTDIVTKETYDFKDRGERDMTLRPEGTAGVVRSYIENKYYGNANQPSKIWYYGPMYRYERPQSGRYREHYQFGCEVFGSLDPLMDAEIISIPVNIFRILGLKGIKVNINSLGDKESRDNYRIALKEYFKPYLNQLCDDCKERFEKNPLRLLDCKTDSNLDIMKNAPKIIDYLNTESKNHFDKVCSYLKDLNIDYIVNPNTVRGLDYYTHTVFEVEANVEGFGSQNVLCGGGRYNNLVETLNGPSTPGVGFGMGTERLLKALEFENINLINEKSIDAYIIPMSDNEKGYCLNLCNNLRLSGFVVEMDYMNRNINSNFKQSERLNSRYVIIVGEEEIKNNYLTVKDSETHEEEKVQLNDIIDYLDDCCCDECHCHD